MTIKKHLSRQKNKAKISHAIFRSELTVHALYSLSGSLVLLPLFPRVGFEISSYRCSQEAARRPDPPSTHPAESQEKKKMNDYQLFDSEAVFL